MNDMDKKSILVCCGPGCLSDNSDEVLANFKQKLQGQDIDIKAVVKGTGCQGLCEMGPLVRILPQDILYCKVRAADVDEIIEKTIIGNDIVERLLYHDPDSEKRVVSPNQIDFYKGQKKIALRNVGLIDPKSIDDYIAQDGYSALRKVLSQKSREYAIDEIEKSGLRGRGGAGFPTGIKWRQCAEFKESPKYVICNGDEGDPGAFMDRSIIEGDPHSVIEGMTICAYAIGANNGFMYIRDEYFLAISNMTHALKQARASGFLGKNILGSGFDFDIEIVRGGGAFVCGESTALIASIEGRVGEPRAKYIHSNEQGLWYKPTVLNNVETWANVPFIINQGAERFGKIGTKKSKGTKVFSLVGKVKNTGLIEVPMGMPLRQIIFDIGGGINGNRKFKAVQTGGPSGGCIPEDHLDINVDFDSLAEAGSMMGSGGMIVMDDRSCMVDVARYYLNFLSGESCGKCIPCREGIKRMLEILNDICCGKGREGDLELLMEIAETVEEASLCGLGKTAPNPVITTLRYFKDEYIAHIKEKRCPAGVCRELTSYHIDQELCRGCGLCSKQCPQDAIAKRDKYFAIDESLCVKCGSCIDTCRFDAIKVGGRISCK